MSMGSSGLFRGTAGAIAEESDAPIGFNDTPPETPEIVTGAHAFPCYDHVPRTICPPLTVGVAIRAMENHQLARFLSAEVVAGAMLGTFTEKGYFDWLNRPAAEEKRRLYIEESR